MQETFHQYTLITELASKYSHSTYLASPINEPESQMVLTVFASSLFRFPHEHEGLLKKAQRIKKFQYPHVASILDMGIEQEQPFVVREYCPSGSLRSSLKKLSPGRLELREALTIVSQVGQALLYAHERNIVHGNMKPENILLDADGQAVLTDFSLLDRTDALIRDQTAEEYAFCYLAPEQFTGKCDARSDQYALGCLAYELITGRVSFVAQSLASMMGRPSNAQPAPLSESVANLPPSLETAILKALAQDPDERFFDFSLFLEVIQAVLSPPPAFPLLHSANSRKNRMISHAAQSTKAKTVSSSIHKHTTKQTTPQSLEPSALSSSAEVDVAESLNTASISQTSMTEWSGILPVSESLEAVLQSDQFSFLLPGEGDPLGEREQEKEADDLVVTDIFLQEKVDVAADTTLFLIKSTDTNGSRFVRSLRKRARVLRFAVPLSVIMVVAVIASAFWTANMSTPETRSPSPKKMIQVVPLTKATDVLTVQPSVQAANVPTVQLTAQATAIPAVQSLPSISTSTDVPAPTPTPPISYEAEASQNILAGGAAVGNCSGCSGGAKVINLGLHNGSDGTLQFPNVSEESTSSDTLTIYYLDAASDRVLYMSLNGGSAIALTASGTGNRTTIAVLTVTVVLHAGNNTIEFSNPSAYAPDIDRIVV